jgi:hypothetical protein
MKRLFILLLPQKSRCPSFSSSRSPVLSLSSASCPHPRVRSPCEVTARAAPPLPPVLTGQASSLPSYLLDKPRPSPVLTGHVGRQVMGSRDGITQARRVVSDLILGRPTAKANRKLAAISGRIRREL